MIVSKFGGTSVQNSTAILNVFSIISKKTKPTFIVVSAFSKVTDSLVNLVESIKQRNSEQTNLIIENIFDRHLKTAKELGIERKLKPFLATKKDELSLFAKPLSILGEVSSRSVDYILSYGELLSSYLIYSFFLSKGLKIVYFDPRDIIKTDSNFTCAEVDFVATKNSLMDAFSKNKNSQYWITGGFVGSNNNNETTTLGRGGSDYSASVIASVLNAEVLEIWTDVDGILTTDPKVVSNAKLIKEVSYDEASELAIFGAKVLHPKTIFPAVAKKIPVYVLNSFKPDSRGTLISYRSPKKKIVKAIAFRKNITVVNIKSNRMFGVYGYLAQIFDIFNKYRTSVDLVSTSEISVSLTIEDTTHLETIIKELSNISSVEILRNCSIVSVVGEGLKDSTTIASRIFNVLRNIKIIMVSMGASDINFSFVVYQTDLEKTIKLLHNEFFENNFDRKIFEEVQ